MGVYVIVHLCIDGHEQWKNSQLQPWHFVSGFKYVLL